MVTRLGFQQVAKGLFEEFKDFVIPRLFVTPKTGGTGNPVTGAITEGSAAVVEGVPAIRTSFELDEVDGKAVQRNDFKLRALASSFTKLSPRADNLFVFVDGVPCKVVNAKQDAANAAWLLHCRSGATPDSFIMDIYEQVDGDVAQFIELYKSLTEGA